MNDNNTQNDIDSDQDGHETGQDVEQPENKRSTIVRDVVVPGDLLDTGKYRAGTGTYKDGANIYSSQLGFKDIRSNYINVISFSGKYIPRQGDSVIGKVIDLGPSNWVLDINSPYNAVLYVNEVPWDVDFGATSKFIGVGEIALIKIVGVDEIKRVQATMKGIGLRKLSGGLVIEISATKVPRVIGKSGTMISLLKKYSNCRMFVGQNGRIWLDGELDNIILATQAIQEIESKAHTTGLTAEIERFLMERTQQEPLKL